MIGSTRLRLNQDIARQQRLASDIRRDQTEIATGLRIQTPSDDPIASAAVAVIVRAQSDIKSWQSNAETAADIAAAADTILSTMQSLLDGAATILSAARSGSQSADVRSIASGQLHSIAEEIASLADARDMSGNRLFPEDLPIAIPVGDGQSLTPTLSSGNAFSSDGLSIVAILNDASAALAISDKDRRQAATAVALDRVNVAVAGATIVRGKLGIVAERIERVKENLAQHDVALTESRAELESADIAAVIARLQGRQITLEAAQAVFARINRQTLFDILR